jgi:O-acetyl-ADP-ribose deacetylase (regulator of RNase III)
VVFVERLDVIEYQTKDITTVTAGIVAHGVNCQRTMGSGVALAVRKKWPTAYDAYRLAQPILGTICWTAINDDLHVANCFTQDRFGSDGRKYASEVAIASCFRDLFRIAKANDCVVYLPRIGCGLGGLDWEEDIEPLLSPYGQTNRIVVCDIN